MRSRYVLELRVPRFFFRVSDGKTFIDRGGTELHNLQAAKREAARFASEMIAGADKLFQNNDEWTMRVENASGDTLFSLKLSAESSSFH